MLAVAAPDLMLARDAAFLDVMLNTDSGVRSDLNVFQTLRRDARSLWKDAQRTGFKRTIDRTFGDLQEFYVGPRDRDASRG